MSGSLLFKKRRLIVNDSQERLISIVNLEAIAQTSNKVYALLI